MNCPAASAFMAGRRVKPRAGLILTSPMTAGSWRLKSFRPCPDTDTTVRPFPRRTASTRHPADILISQSSRLAAKAVPAGPLKRLERGRQGDFAARAIHLIVGPQLPTVSAPGVHGHDHHPLGHSRNTRASAEFAHRGMILAAEPSADQRHVTRTVSRHWMVNR